MWIIEQTSFGSDLAAHALSLASLGGVFYPNQPPVCTGKHTSNRTFGGLARFIIDSVVFHVLPVRAF